MIQFLFRQFVLVISNFTELLEFLYRSLFRLGRNEEHGGGSLLRNILMFPLRMIGGLVAAGGWLIMFPFHAATTFQGERRQNFLWGVPAVIGALFAVLVPVYTFFRGDAVDGQYRVKALAAIRNGEFETAKVFLGRVVNKDANVDPNDQFYWAIVLANTGQPTRAGQIVDKLAPDDSPGYSKAHRYKALRYSMEANQDRDPELLRRLRFHLENSGDSDSPEINQAWATYHISVDQSEEAVKHLEVAARKNPKFLLSIADIYKSMDNENGRARILKKAEDTFREQLIEDPLRVDARISLASILAQKTRFEEAEKTLTTGLSLQPDAKMRRATADFFVMRYDVTRDANGPFATRMEYLQRAIACEESHLPIYNRLMDHYKSVDSEDAGEEVKDTLAKAIASGEATAFAHFILGNILWMEENKTEGAWHIEKAYMTDKKLVSVANNFAWVLAHQDEPDLERALGIMEDVLQKVPDDPRYLDTYGTVLTLMDRNEEAITPFEKALGKLRNKLPVHKKLEQVYRRLGKEKIAMLHRVEARKLMEQLK